MGFGHNYHVNNIRQEKQLFRIFVSHSSLFCFFFTCSSLSVIFIKIASWFRINHVKATRKG